jgi:hypothetical protein
MAELGGISAMYIQERIYVGTCFTCFMEGSSVIDGSYLLWLVAAPFPVGQRLIIPGAFPASDEREGA